jgi:hypothetical protein
MISLDFSFSTRDLLSMMPSLLVLEHWSWPLAPWTLHAAYLLAAMLVAVHYVPQLRCAWRHPDATRNAHSLRTWVVWSICSVVSWAYGACVLHNLVFLMVVSADFLGRFGMVLLILRARMLGRQVGLDVMAMHHSNSCTTHSGLSPRATRCTYS